MPGVPGRGGPVPKRSDQRRRVNKPPQEPTRAAGAVEVAVPDGDPDWHPVALRLFESLKASGQARFYEPSDWATAFMLCESVSREMKPQPVGDHGVLMELPPKAASIAAWLKGLTALMATEGDRRRAAMELQRPASPKEAGPDVAEFDEYRRRLRGAGAS